MRQVPSAAQMKASGERANPGTQKPDGQRKDDKINTRNISFSTYNTQMLFQAGKFDQLVRPARDILAVDIIGIQEHRWTT